MDFINIDKSPYLMSEYNVTVSVIMYGSFVLAFNVFIRYVCRRRIVIFLLGILRTIDNFIAILFMVGFRRKLLRINITRKIFVFDRKCLVSGSVSLGNTEEMKSTKDCVSDISFSICLNCLNQLIFDVNIINRKSCL